jgi:hypothetical protein
MMLRHRLASLASAVADARQASPDANRHRPAWADARQACPDANRHRPVLADA